MWPSLLPKLLPQLSDVNGNFNEMVRVISLEQTLTAKLLQICNSALFGQEETLTSVTQDNLEDTGEKVRMRGNTTE